MSKDITHCLAFADRQCMAPAVQPEASAGAGRQLRCCLLLADQRAPLALLCAELDLFGTECCSKSDTTVSAPAAPLCFSLLDQSVILVGVVLTISQFLSLILTSTGDQMYSPQYDCPFYFCLPCLWCYTAREDPQYETDSKWSCSCYTGHQCHPLLCAPHLQVIGERAVILPSWSCCCECLPWLARACHTCLHIGVMIT